MLTAGSIMQLTYARTDLLNVQGSEGYKKGGYHPVFIGEKYKAGRYQVLKKLGWGHFSTVWLVLDKETGKYGAMKVR